MVSTALPSERINPGQVVAGHTVIKAFDIRFSKKEGSKFEAKALSCRGIGDTIEQARYHMFLAMQTDLAYLPVAEEIGDRPEHAEPYREHFGGFPSRPS
ncbi:hypothetical protein AUJ46_02125 [Candidatus Peregrinibacteria bacterium CG1_02_54_53]|nr:MAG: hypothetical protein AUJ46_02125 [Candidatus Peregrinibacteria bacterium CG1_02_54_53]